MFLAKFTSGLPGQVLFMEKNLQRNDEMNAGQALPVFQGYLPDGPA